jgi:hypothetical protein
MRHRIVDDSPLPARPANRDVLSVDELSEPSLPKPGLTVLALAAFLVLFGTYLLFIHSYGVNTIYNDQWWDVQLLHHWYSGRLSLSDLWTQHGDNRILFPNLVMLLVARLAHLNTVVEAYVSGLLLLASISLIICAHKRRSPGTNLIWYVPVVALLVSVVQYQDTLWGFQLAWYLVYVALASSLFLLDRLRLTWLALGGAVILAVVGSYSSLQGLLIWPVGLLLLCQRNRAPRKLLVWLGCAVVTAAVYFYNLNPSGGGTSSYVLSHPLTAMKFLLITIGDVLGVGVPPTPNAGTDALMVFGLVILLLASWVLFTFGRHRDEVSGIPLGVALTAYGVLFAILVTISRTRNGLPFADSSHYTTFNLLIPAGCYLTLLSARAQPQRGSASDKRAALRRVSMEIATVTVVFVVGTQMLIGTVNGFHQANGWKNEQQLVGQVTANGTKATEGYVDATLLPGCPCPDFAAGLLQLVHVAREHRLSLFGTEDAASYAEERMPHDPAPTTRIVSPSPGQGVRGAVLVVITVAALSDVTRMDVLLSGGSFHDARIASATSATYAWLAGWRTSTVPNGAYWLQSVAYDATGSVGRSPSTLIRVDN